MHVRTNSAIRLSLLMGFVVPWLLGCAQPPGNSPLDDSGTDPGRSAFKIVPLPITGAVGDDPQALAQAIYGSTEPVEGNYTEEVVTLSSSPDQQVILFTQLGLADDSLRGVRYRLELQPQGGQWKLSWAGRQVSCWPMRGHEDWSTEPCL